ncbi:23S rRNA (cytosine1962-C5)-methyltransferase [Monaibacterium marinum]|uniref:23S rRNA (Cytosine1962-C5)-methyltransferase n=1 Tax=Pontivivens marinum TaxID=1690039 RepID=A0A2C9CMF7_9RHOB|nr:class I SAM-dependent rRNA methyltransferase [Monaibacterium marinum]SOH92397.1 23S rRNA (cytosine1962-C5)-methyltransferase [Monaibacterium marinum]
MTDQNASPSTARPVVRLRPGRARTVRFGFPWVYADELVLDRRSKSLTPGTFATLEDADRVAIGTVTVNSESRIPARLMDRDPEAVIDAAWLESKLRFAFEHRSRLFAEPFYRLIHAEADGLPGVIIDRFGDAAVIQPNAAWAEAMYAELEAAVIAVTGVSSVVKNASGRARKLDGLDEESAVTTGQIDAPIPVKMNGATYMADLLGGQKTGLFLDQRANHAFAAGLAAGGEVLDVFSHVGGFALAALAGGAKSALSVDGSAPALALAEEGARAMGASDRFATRRGDAFDTMTAMVEEGVTYDLVVCDPPAFAPTKQTADKGLRAYERVARMSAALVKPGGYLVLCSCSHAADLAKFRDASLRGVARGGRVAQLIHTGFAGPDHPTHAMLAETAYLKALFLRLE